MANSIVRLPLGYFPDPKKGRPLFDASIYVGEPDLDPRTPANQKTVTGRQENGTETPLSQPIATSAGGVPVDDSGNYVTLLVDGAYSMAVDDKNDNQVYYFANVLDGAPVTFDVFGETLAGYTNIDFKNIADAKAGLLPDGVTNIDLEVGYRVSTRGYTTENDGGEGEYIVVAPLTGTDDGGSYIDLNNGNQLELIVGDEVSVKQFGATGDGVTDDASTSRAAIAFSDNILFPSNNNFYIASGEVSVDLDTFNPSATAYFVLDKERGSVRIEGAITYKNDDANSSNPNLFYISANNVTIDGGVFTHDDLPLTRYINSGNVAAPFEVENFTFKNGVCDGTRQGVVLYRTTDSKILNSIHKASSASDGSSAAFKVRGGNGNLLDGCTSYYGLTDGNMGIFGTGFGNKIQNCNLYNRDTSGNAGLNTAQGISIDSGQNYVACIGNYVDDFFYNIDVKTNINGCQVVGNVVKTKKVAISVRYGEGTQNLHGCTITGNTIVFAEGSTAATPAIVYTPTNPNDDSGGYTTCGVLVDHVEEGVTITGNTFTADAGSSTTFRAVGVVVKGNANTGDDLQDKTSTTVTGNNFNFYRNAGAEVNIVHGPALGIEGEVHATGTEMPNVVFGNNTLTYANKVDATVFSMIDGKYAESLISESNTIQKGFTYGPIHYLENCESVIVSDNSFGSPSSTKLFADTCSRISYNSNLSGSANLDSTDVNLTDCNIVIVNSNIFDRASAVGLAVSSIGTTDSFVCTGNYARGISPVVSTTATNNVTANNVLITV